MLNYICKRLLQIIPVLLVVTFLIVCMTRFVPGDPIRSLLGDEGNPEQYAELREAFGLDKPIWQQFIDYLKNALSGDLGISYFRQRPILEEIKSRFPSTIKIAVIATVVSSAIGIVFGVVAALNRGKFMDSLIMVFSLVALSTPIFFMAIILMILFGIKLKWLPVMSMGLSSWKMFVLPVAALATQSVATVARTMRSSMLDVLGEDYIRTAKAAGIPNRVVIYKNGLRNALIPIITVVGVQFGQLLTGAVITEQVFSISGLGRYLVDNVMQRDYPAIQGSVLLFALIFVVVNLVTDLCYGLADPRISYE